MNPASLNADDLALDQYVAEGILHGRIPGIFRPEFDMIRVQKESLDRCFLAGDQGHDNLAALGILTRFADGKITVQDAGRFHGIAFNAQGEKIPAGENIGVEDQAAVPFLLRIQGKSGRDSADNRHFAPSVGRGGLAGLIQKINYRVLFSPLKKRDLFVEFGLLSVFP